MKKIINIFEKKRVSILLLILISVIIYGNSLHVPFILDDKAKIVDNPDIKSLSNIKTKLIYSYKEAKHFYRNDPSRPITYLTYTLNYHFGKLNPFGYHLFNIILHIATGILIFFLTKKIIEYITIKSQLIPLLSALLFIVHPINTSSVTYIYSRGDVLATFFYISSLLFFIESIKKNKSLYIFSLITFVFALFSKPNAVTLPAIVLMFDYMFLSDYKIKEVIKKKYYHVPFWIVLIFYLLFRHFYLGEIGDLESLGENNLWNTYSYFIIEPYVILKYLKLLIVPKGLCIDHYIMPKNLFELKILISMFSILMVLIIVFIIARRKTDYSRIFLFSVLWFFITLSPTSSFFPTTTPMCENRLYLAGFGFYFIVAFVYCLILSKCHRGFALLPIIHLFILGYLTVQRNHLYQNPIMLWSDAATIYPYSERAHNFLALEYLSQQQYDKVIVEFKKVAEIDPNNPKAHLNLAVSYHKNKDYENAIQEYKKTIELDTNNELAYKNLGSIYYLKGQYQQAIKEYSNVLKINLNNSEVYNDLGGVYFAMKKYNIAILNFQKALQNNPNYASAHKNIGVVYHIQKKYDNAFQSYQKALEINPQDIKIYYFLGLVEYEKKNYKKALYYFKIFQTSNPEHKDTKNKLKIINKILNLN